MDCRYAADSSYSVPSGDYGATDDDSLCTGRRGGRQWCSAGNHFQKCLVCTKRCSDSSHAEKAGIAIDGGDHRQPKNPEVECNAPRPIDVHQAESRFPRPDDLIVAQVRIVASAKNLAFVSEHY